MYSDQQRQDILANVVDQMIDGKSVRSICMNDPSMPDRITLLRWMNEDKAFASTIARARELQAEALHDDMADMCRKMESGEIDANTGKAIIWAKQWSAARMNRARYGDKIVQEVTGADGQALALAVNFISPQSATKQD
jgi:hypothetical protein